MLSRIASAASRSVIRRVEVIGVFGSGKTFLVNSLDSRFKKIRERHTANRFWGRRSFQEASGFLAYDLDFLLDHYYLATRTNTRNGIAVCDWSFVSDRVWALLRQGRDSAVYRKVHEELTDAIPEPIGYIFLDYPARLIHQRIQSRGRAPEATITADDVVRAKKALSNAVEKLPSARVLTLKTSDIRRAHRQVAEWEAQYE